MSGTNQRGGASASLQAATILLGQINAFIPVAVTAGTAIVALIKAARSRGEMSEAEADAAIAKFSEVTQNLKTSVDQWLADHPPVSEDGPDNG